MTAGRPAPLRRLVAALEVLRAGPPAPDYGLLLVTPFLAAAGGLLVSLAVDIVVERRRARHGRRRPAVSGGVEVWAPAGGR